MYQNKHRNCRPKKTHEELIRDIVSEDEHQAKKMDENNANGNNEQAIIITPIQSQEEEILTPESLEIPSNLIPLFDEETQRNTTASDLMTDRGTPTINDVPHFREYMESNMVAIAEDINLNDQAEPVESSDNNDVEPMEVSVSHTVGESSQNSGITNDGPRRSGRNYVQSSEEMNGGGARSSKNSQRTPINNFYNQEIVALFELKRKMGIYSIGGIRG